MAFRLRVLLQLLAALLLLLRFRKLVDDWLRRQLNRLLTQRHIKRLSGSEAKADPFIRLKGGREAFEKIYAIIQRITDSTFGSVFECRKIGDVTEASSVVKIVEMRSHPLLSSEERKLDKRVIDISMNTLGAKSTKAFGNELPVVVSESKSFRRYMSKLLALDQENVVRYLEFFADASSYYFVMERCPGRTLLEHLLAEPTWQESSVLPLMKQLLTALKYIHSQGIVHRDVKLENIMVVMMPPVRRAFFRPSPLGACPLHLKLLDFGLGCERDSAQGVFGTLGYMAPEVFGKQHYSYAADIFSAGAVMHICLTGRPAFLPPLNARFLETHRQALYQGPDFRKSPLPAVTSPGRQLLGWMLLPSALNRCTAEEALSHPWISQEHTPNGPGPVLWSSSASELQFLRVMGVWNGASSANNSMAGHRSTLKVVDEEEDEEGEGPADELCTRVIQPMEVPVCIADPSTKDCEIIAVSRGFTMLTGYKLEDIKGRNCRILNASCRAEITADVLSQCQAASLGAGSFLGILPNMRKDGSRFDNLLHLSSITVKGRAFVVGVQCEVEGTDIDVSDHEIVGASRKVHAAIRHYLRGAGGKHTDKMSRRCKSLTF